MCPDRKEWCWSPDRWLSSSGQRERASDMEDLPRWDYDTGHWGKDVPGGVDSEAVSSTRAEGSRVVQL